MTTNSDRYALLRIARDAIVSHISGPIPSGQATDHVEAPPSVGTRPGAAFVTVHVGGKLRGCIGHLETNEPLGRVVRDCAISACSANPRFPAVSAAELDDLSIELSLLGPLETVTRPEDIEVGRHGLVVARGGRRGLLLPQVATEWGWDRETFLAQTCHKAGLPRDAWKNGATVWRFEAEVFSEDESNTRQPAGT